MEQSKNGMASNAERVYTAKELRQLEKENNRRVDEMKEKNRQLVLDMELEARYYKASSDILRFQYEKMDYYLKIRDLQDVYNKAVEEDLKKIEEESVKDQEPKSNIISLS